MKKLLAMLLVLVMSISICACGSDTGESDATNESEESVKENITTVENGQKVVVDGKYEFTIDSWKHGDKIEGKHNANSSYSYSPMDAIAYIEMEYKNLSSETISTSNAFGGSEMKGELVVDGNSYPIGTYLPKDIVPLDEGIAYIYYTISEDAIKGATEKVATFSFGEEVYEYVLKDEQVRATSNDAVEIKIDDTITVNDSYEFTVKKVSSGSKLEDGGGNITYSYAPSDYQMWIELDFKNLGTETLEEWDCPLFNEGKYELIYDEKYEYSGGAWFSQDIPALGEATVFIYFEVPEDVKDSDGSKVATFEIGDSEYLFNF